jgi:DtxR family Mn-dependent transcriptional regulator
LRVSDQDSEKLCYLGELGLYPEVHVQLVSRAPFGGPLLVRVGEAPNQVEHMLGAELANQIQVTIPQESTQEKQSV